MFKCRLETEKQMISNSDGIKMQLSRWLGPQHKICQKFINRPSRVYFCLKAHRHTR